MFWDNRNYPANPSRGNALTLELTRDWGFADSSASWTNLSTEYDQYIPLGDIAGFRQSVLALDFWTAYSPTWDVQPDRSMRTARRGSAVPPWAGSFG